MLRKNEGGIIMELTEHETKTYTVKFKYQNLKLHNEKNNILLIDRKGTGDYMTLCHTPKGMKWLISYDNMYKPGYQKADAVWVICPTCKKKTNDFGNCPSQKCYSTLLNLFV